jgi:tetratricopeptide (TPR) repeat protein
MVPRRRPASVARTALLLGSLLAIAGCDVLGQADIIRNLRKEPSGPEVSAPLTEQGLGKLAKGEMIAANALFDQALKANPADVYALTGKGLIMQRWNEPSQARQAYQAVLALHPDPSIKIVTAGSPEPQSVLELATQNLEALEHAGVAQGGAMLVPASAAQSMPAAPTTAAQPTRGANARPPVPFLNEADANTMARFETLGKLRDQGLITPDEYAERRRANIGALLPYTNPKPASTGLDRPVPAAEQIVGRLNAINRALEMRAINMRQHAAERTTIIDGLLPVTPRATMNPALPPKGLLENADAVRRLEATRERGLISAEEYAKEKEAIDKLATVPTPPPPTAAAAPTTPVTGTALSGGPQPAVHIASYRSEDDAQKGWAQLRRAYPQLGPLQPEVSRVNLGAQKGVFYRLLAGPLPSQPEAERICRELKAKRQFCEVAFMGGGSSLTAPRPAPARAAAPAPARAPAPPPQPAREATDDSGN